MNLFDEGIEIFGVQIVRQRSEKQPPTSTCSSFRFQGLEMTNSHGPPGSLGMLTQLPVLSLSML
jgi:hypothetical protein